MVVIMQVTPCEIPVNYTIQQALFQYYRCAGDLKYGILAIKKSEGSVRYMTTDILIIGAGITGTALAREISRYDVSCVVIDRACDVAEGATKANSGIVHAGYDAVPGTLKAKYNVAGAAAYPGLCRELGVPYRCCGALVIGFDKADEATLRDLLERGIRNGVEGLRILDHDDVLKMEPNLNPEVHSALYVPTSAIVSPYELAFALADDAALNGVVFRFDQPVRSVEKTDSGCWKVCTDTDQYECRAVVNCAGASGAEIHNMISDNPLEMIHRRGQYYLLDRAERQPFEMTVFQCPSRMGKGVLVSPTVHGNLLLGPTAEDIGDPLDTATTAEGLAEILQKAGRTWPGISTRTNITNFSGIRAHLTTGDFMVGPVSGCENAYEAVGIESPGLSSAPAIAEDLCRMIAGEMKWQRKDDDRIRPVPAREKAFSTMTAEERSEMVRKDPLYGNIICRCEMVTEAEIRQAIRRPVGARTIDGVKRRTRAGMGRCQGGFCLPRVAAIIAEETGCSLAEVTKDGGNSRILAEPLDAFLKGGGDCE